MHTDVYVMICVMIIAALTLQILLYVSVNYFNLDYFHFMTQVQSFAYAYLCILKLVLLKFGFVEVGFVEVGFVEVGFVEVGFC